MLYDRYFVNYDGREKEKSRGNFTLRLARIIVRESEAVPGLEAIELW